MVSEGSAFHDYNWLEMSIYRATKITILTALTIFGGTKVTASDIYRWVDENGVQHFSQYQPVGDIPNVSLQKLEQTTSAEDGRVEDIYNVEEHEKRMAAWREDKKQARKDARERKTLATQQQPIRYQEPVRNYWYPPIYSRPPNRPPNRPPQKPEPPIEKPRPPSVVKPGGVSR